MVSSPESSQFSVGYREGCEWMLRLLESPDADQARSLLDEKCLQFREEGRELRQWETGFVSGAERAFRDSWERR
jgi:hypothetical protein